MHRFVETMRSAWSTKFSFDVSLGIGVASGAAVVGNLGSEKRMEYTAIGDVVNVAARLESMAKPGQTLLTSVVAKGAGDRFDVAPLGAQVLRGKSEKVEVYELVVL
jgi:adenylate cyclase